MSGRPLLDTRPDQLLFVDRGDELGRVRAALGQGLNCLVVGERGSGKTSLVRALMFQERQAAVSRGDVHPTQETGLPSLLYVRGAGVDGAVDLLRRAVEALARHHGGLLAAPTAGTSDRLATSGMSGGPATSGTSDQLVAELGGLARTGPVVMVLDDVPAAVGNALFGALRDELWSIDLRWLVTVATGDAATLLRPPADAFFESQVTLGSLQAEVSMEILRRRMGEVPDRLLADVAAIGGGNPRRLLDIARELGGDFSQWAALASAAAERARAMAALGRSAQMLAAELEALGGASASDERLLTRMGWTRPRVVQVLAEMEAAGLVTASSLKTGQGRPRKIYQVVSPAQFLQWRAEAAAPGPAS